MQRLLLLAALCGFLLPLSGQRVILTAIVDGDETGGLPKAIELYVEGTVDLADYSLVRFSNGGTFPGNITLSGTFTDRFVYVINSSEENEAAFAAAFGTSGDFADPITSGNVNGNGDDRFDLLLGGEVVDRIGGVPGVRENLYRDGFLYRLDGLGPNPDFDVSEFRGGNGALDGQDVSDYKSIVMLGTYRGLPAGRSISAGGNGSLAEPATDGGFTITLSEPSTEDVSVSYSLSGSATAGEDYLDNTNGTVVITAGTTMASVSLEVIDDNEVEGEEDIVLTIVSVSDDSYTIGGDATIVITDEDVALVFISEVQGPGFASPIEGARVAVEGIVVGDFPGLLGFYVQEEASDYDDDPNTSEGVFVFFRDAEVALGDRVRVVGEVDERFGQTQIAADLVNVLSGNNILPAASPLSLPRTDAELETLEGMSVAPLDLVVTDNSDLARFGSVEVTSDERLIQFTECNRPDADALDAYEAAQDRDVILIDDGRNSTNTTPILLPDGSILSADNTLRAGETITGLTGVLGFGFNRYRIQPTLTEGVSFVGNGRPEAAPAVGGEVTVVSANVLNYFTTLNSRGADTQEEFERQEAKIVNALCALDADIVGLIEIENNDNVALATLVNALNAACGTSYDYVVSPNTGDDQIMVALIYKTDRVEESGTAAALADPASVFVGRNTNRVPLAQTFRVVDQRSLNFGQEVTVVVNHFKSKGGRCGTGDDDFAGGAGACDGTRTAAAEAITEWLTTNPTGVAEPDVLIIGDLNAYRMEAPIQTILDAGYFNPKVTLSHPGSFPCGGGFPSYVFRGQWGSLDYILASDGLSGRVTGAAAWNVNAPEPAVLDYNTEGASDALYADDFYRFSDHDPIVIGLDLGPALTMKLTEFTGSPKGNKVQLRWRTATDITAEEFEVQRLDEEGNFVTVGTVKVSGGSSNGNRVYVFNDQGAVSGDNVYRLKLVEADGTARFSEELTVTLFSKRMGKSLVAEGYGSYRVPAYAPGSRFTLVSMSGQVLSEGSLDASAGVIRTQGLPAGIYAVRVEGGAVYRVMVR